MGCAEAFACLYFACLYKVIAITLADVWSTSANATNQASLYSFQHFYPFLLRSVPWAIWILSLLYLITAATATIYNRLEEVFLWKLDISLGESQLYAREAALL